MQDPRRRLRRMVALREREEAARQAREEGGRSLYVVRGGVILKHPEKNWRPDPQATKNPGGGEK